MKKLLLFLLVLVSLTFFTACELYEIPLPVFEYGGKPIEEITYSSVDYMGGYTVTHKIDFVENKVYRKEYNPYYDFYKELSEDDMDPEEYQEIINSTEYQNIIKLESYKNNDVYIEIGNFTEEQEKRFIDACSSYGLFRLWKNYITLLPIMDGGGWDFSVTYADGTSRESHGSNASPTFIFAKCAPEFYDLCGRRILGYLPQKYYIPPSLMTSYSIQEDNMSELGSRGYLADYSWNDGKFTSDNDDLYAINQYNLRFSDAIDADKHYSISFSAQGDMYQGQYPKFERFVFKSYDYNEQLSGEKIICDTGWFGGWMEYSDEFELELNKIYVYELHYKNGDYVRYTFNTKVQEEMPRLELDLSAINGYSGSEEKTWGIRYTLASYSMNGSRYDIDEDELYEISNKLTNSSMYLSCTYFVTFSTEGYVEQYGDNKFEKLVLRSYRYDEELSDERVEFECGWFDGESERIELEFDRIYVYELHFANGDCVTYTFNTKYDSRY